MFYELAASSWGEEELDAIQRVIASDRFTIGQNVANFEEEFAAYHGRRHCVMVNSGSSANLVGIAALAFKQGHPLKPGDEVIVPAIAWATTYYPLLQYGLRLRFVDVESDTLNMDVSQLEKALTPKTRMVMGVSILGNPAALDTMRQFCDAHDLHFFEDNCESMDAELDGKKAGTFGDISTFSTFFSHHISTMEGGMITTDDEELFHLCKSLRSHGWTRDIPENSPICPPKQDDFSEAYRFILPGYNVRPLELSAAIGLEQIKKLPAMTSRRRKNLALFQKLFSGDNRFEIQRENGASSSFCFTVILNTDVTPSRDTVMVALKEADIGFRMITGGCFPRHDVIKYFDYDCLDDLPNANRAHDHGFFVGNHPFDLTPQITRLHEVLTKTCA
ncbi:MAG: DegT/DnrJ/EryC1/StrS family aminotransferase [Rhodospirillales bacterium]|jgi:CDP-6-deoxy-D-xylo-4-hexulose-3-dehydrase|nr:DegT/DnrJ/EryC1/StrS family aminotransferase [Rhodospirillales bacterium]MBT4006544.1 DegT/DnrJ/EryC1/StrS family aminotransferase [Rhodospirillales bacterium]MBT5077207.1 DegT/DnrJ/EryC1/StrS family aminotransferase [Rhodospirillales bacterium]MBT5113822.1 DegT/DnrJ/EryC1/StrS family aminotransferase [Rhodospirillales bacterium]MBT5672350.1 DegT/DnrJ/EryC1/StrS family aminotransferase [Rhodospirillales bacterium]